jgi:uncharacterized membrane protein YgcG
MIRPAVYLIISLVLPALCAFQPPALADERILDYRSDINIHEDGQLTVTETIRVRAEGRNIQRGIYRDFPTHYKDRFGNHVNVRFDPVSVRRNGNSEAWHAESRPNGIRVYAGSANRILDPGIHEYELVFLTDRQLGFFDDHDELYFNVIGNGWIFPIDRAEATITLPFRSDASQLVLDTYTGAYGSKETSATAEVLGENRIRFQMTRPLTAREGMTVAVAWPKGLIAEPTWGQRISWFLGDNGAALILLLGLLAPLAWYYWAWNRVGRDPLKGVIIPRFKPPQGLSPAACRYVKDMTFNRYAFTAAIISLAVKGQLTIDEDDEEFTLERVPDTAEAQLSKGEQALLDTLLPLPSSSIAMDNENYKEFQAARKALKKELKKEYLGRLFHLNSIYQAPPVLMSVGAAIIAWFFDGGPAVWVSYLFLTMGLHGMFTFLMRAPTPAGRMVMDEIDGLEMYLDTAEQDRLDRMRSLELTPEVFEAFLPFAYALGVENNWCQRFAHEMPEEVRRQAGYHPRWYKGDYRGVNTLDHLGDNFSSSFSSAISSASSPPGSSSGSGGGGFSGGGGGGGGGGGW